MYSPKGKKRADSGYGAKKFRSRPSAGGRKPYSRDEGDRESFSAVCGTCGKDCRVPFRPNGKKPVLCTNCFKKDGSRDRTPTKRYGNDRSSRPTGSDDQGVSEQLRAINKKLDAILDAVGSIHFE